ncbi:MULTISPECIES: hypothetical protein [Kordiimonas]|jgi:predicted metal-dependent enzyme (double-stranded beta helix superfamily)|uniref:hypothetical protein n=1 Tax=Kordiimonas TaxID=288021 RepID=UPI00257F4462|nr:hypothetical protein [Kordiimonas sp. UBA4487]
MSTTKAPNLVARRTFLLAAAALSTQLIRTPMAKAETVKKPVNLNKKVNLDHFIADCIEANNEADAQMAVREVLAKAVSKPGALLNALGEPDKAGIQILHQSAALTIFNAMWTPQMNLLPHNHLMWANIGIYTGREDNILWRKNEHTIEAYGAEALFEGDVGTLGHDIVHSVTNPLLRFTGGIHIYGGDFFHTTRSEWDPETLDERPSDGQAIQAMFAAENERRAKK